VALPEWRYQSATAQARYRDDLLLRLRATGSIENVAVTDRLPQLDGEPATEVRIAGQRASRPEDRPWGVVSTVSDEFFATAGVPILAGRAFNTSDSASQPGVAVINREMARRHWGSPDVAIGAHLSLASDAAGVTLQVVGVVDDVLRGDREGVNPQVYVDARQRPAARLGLLVRAADPVTAAPLVRAQMRALDADVPLFEVRPLQQALDEDLSSSHILGSLFMSFALLALVLAASGLYAVVSYAAAQRLKEFGVRLALGATARDIARMMLMQTGRLVAIGLVLGLAGGRVLAAAATTLLYRVSPSDPATYAGVAIGLAAVALGATYVPVRRATAIDPVTALRLE
jgi:putative ABC transport system permease protein